LKRKKTNGVAEKREKREKRKRGKEEKRKIRKERAFLKIQEELQLSLHP